MIVAMNCSWCMTKQMQVWACGNLVWLWTSAQEERDCKAMKNEEVGSSYKLLWAGTSLRSGKAHLRDSAWHWGPSSDLLLRCSATPFICGVPRVGGAWWMPCGLKRGVSSPVNWQIASVIIDECNESYHVHVRKRRRKSTSLRGAVVYRESAQWNGSLVNFALVPGMHAPERFVYGIELIYLRIYLMHNPIIPVDRVIWHSTVSWDGVWAIEDCRGWKWEAIWGCEWTD